MEMDLLLLVEEVEWILPFLFDRGHLRHQEEIVLRHRVVVGIIMEALLLHLHMIMTDMRLGR